MAQFGTNALSQRMQTALYYSRKRRKARRAEQVANEDPDIVAQRDAAFQEALESQNAKSGS